jgi:hypothetical protein
MPQSFLEEVVIQVRRWQETGEIPEIEQARAIVSELRGVGVFEVTIRMEVGHHSMIGGKPVEFDHSKVPACHKLVAAIHNAIEGINDNSSLKVDLDAGIDVRVKRLS